MYNHITTHDPDGPGIPAYVATTMETSPTELWGMNTCPYNQGVECNDHRCAGCGWKEVTP